MLILAILERLPLVTLVCGSFEFHLSKSKPIYSIYIYNHPEVDRISGISKKKRSEKNL